MVYQIAYISISLVDDVNVEIDSILAKSRKRNGADGLTGLLLFAQGMFLQVLEGDRATIDQTMARISKDPRHDDMTILMEREVPERQFADWEMGWSRVPSDHPAADKIRQLGKPSTYGQGQRPPVNATEEVIQSFFQLNEA